MRNKTAQGESLMSQKHSLSQDLVGNILLFCNSKSFWVYQHLTRQCYAEYVSFPLYVVISVHRKKPK